MPDIGTVTITPSKSLGTVQVKQASRTAVVDPNFRPNVEITTAEILDFSTANVQSGYTFVFNAITQKYEASPVANLDIVITNITGGSF